MTRKEQIQRRFMEFHAANPHVWKLVEKYTLMLIERGFAHHSINAVFERVRWDINVDTKSEEGVKLNNDYRAHYTRLWNEVHPEHAGFFRTRRMRSADKPAYRVDVPVFIEARA